MVNADGNAGTTRSWDSRAATVISGKHGSVLVHLQDNGHKQEHYMFFADGKHFSNHAERHIGKYPSLL
ncbi:MAG: hypothetical protein JW904_10575 [Spirochaetales bacterium]|nr:hypothetical protein [Spirochaetales bacterium]